MPKILHFTRFSLRDLFSTAGLPLILLVLACYLAYRWIDPTPPARVRISTGQENSAYEVLAKRYAAALAPHGVRLELVGSRGSLENLQRLEQDDSGIDLGFVQSGSTGQERASEQGLVSLGSLFTEPVWLFYRGSKEITQLSQLAGHRVNVGAAGSGVPALVNKLLSANGMQPEQLRLSELDNTPATVELLEGRIDALVFSSSPDAPLIQMLLQTPGIRLFDFVQSEAYTRRFPFLTHVVLPRGIVDLGRDIPAHDYHLVAPTATLVARAGLHPAVLDLLAQAVAEIHSQPGWFHKQGEFPSATYSEIPVAPDAKKYYTDGPSWLQRRLPFWLANMFDRMWVVLVAFGALLLPLSRILPPLYVWKVRSRVYHWYGSLRRVEHALEEATEGNRLEVCAQQLKRLDEIEEKVNQVSIPLSFAEELYGLRSHINFVRKRVVALRDRGIASEIVSPIVSPIGSPIVSESGAQPGQAGAAPAAD